MSLILIITTFHHAGSINMNTYSEIKTIEIALGF